MPIHIGSVQRLPASSLILRLGRHHRRDSGVLALFLCHIAAGWTGGQDPLTIAPTGRGDHKCRPGAALPGCRTRWRRRAWPSSGACSWNRGCCPPGTSTSADYTRWLDAELAAVEDAEQRPFIEAAAVPARPRSLTGGCRLRRKHPSRSGFDVTGQLGHPNSPSYADLV